MEVQEFMLNEKRKEKVVLEKERSFITGKEVTLRLGYLSPHEFEKTRLCS